MVAQDEILPTRDLSQVAASRYGHLLKPLFITCPLCPLPTLALLVAGLFSRGPGSKPVGL
jgi:hypothetical protein